MQKIVLNQREVLVYLDHIYRWTFREPQNSELAPIYQVVLEELGRMRLLYNLDLCRLGGPVFRDDKDNSKAINWMRSEGKTEIIIERRDGAATDVRVNSGEMVSMRSLLYLEGEFDYFKLLSYTDIWKPVANEFNMYDYEQTEESSKSYTNKYASENSLRIEECLNSIQQRLSFSDLDDEESWFSIGSVD